MNLPDNRIFDAFVRISDLPKESWPQEVEACSELTDSEKSQLRLLLEEADQTKNSVEEPAVDEEFKRALDERDVTILRQLGAGGMGVVFEGFERSTGRRVAVKRIRTDQGVLEENLSREIGHLSRVHHTNICSLYFSGTFVANKQERSYFVMEFVDGVPLDVYLNVNAVSVSQIQDLLLQLVDGVQHAHSLGVIHRDLKPSNIMVNRESVLKVLDFGISDLCRASDCHDKYPSDGTPGYASPSQMAGGVPSHRMDIYAFGAILESILLNPNVKSQLGRVSFDRVKDLSSCCLECENRRQLNWDEIRSRIIKINKSSLRASLPLSTGVKLVVGLALGVLIMSRTPSSTSLDAVQSFVSIDELAQSILFAGSDRSSLEYAEYGIPEPDAEVDADEITSEAQLTFIYLHSRLLDSMGDQVRCADYLEKSLSRVADDLKVESVTYQAALLDLASLNYSLSRYDKCLSILRELRLFKLQKLHDIFRRSLLSRLSHLLDESVSFSEDEISEVQTWSEGSTVFTELRECLDGTLASSILMMELIDDAVNDIGFDVRFNNVPAEAQTLITQAVTQFKSSSIGSGFLNDKYCLKWEAWLLLWSGKRVRSYELVKNRTRSIKDKVGQFSRTSLAANLDELYFITEYELLFDDRSSYIEDRLSLAQDSWEISKELCADTDLLKLNIAESLLNSMLDQAAYMYSPEESESRIDLGEQAMAVAVQVEGLLSHHYPKAHPAWSDLLFSQSLALAYSQDFELSSRKFIEATENISVAIDMEVFRARYAACLFAVDKFESAVDQLVLNISNADTLQDARENPLRFRTDVVLLTEILDYVDSQPSLKFVSTQLLDRLKKDRNFFRCLRHIEDQFKNEEDLRERPYALAQLSSLYISVESPLEATRILTSSLRTDLVEMLGRSTDPVFFLKPQDQGWWEEDVRLMLIALKMCFEDPLYKQEALSNAVEFISLAESARNQTAWFDVPIYDELVSYISENQGQDYD